jgi:transcriptional regulator
MLAARQCLNEGIPLAHSRIARSAGLPTTRENIALIEEILDELYATGVPRYEWKLPYDPDDVRPLREKGMTLEEIAKELGMSTSSVHRFLKRAS